MATSPSTEGSPSSVFTKGALQPSPAKVTCFGCKKLFADREDTVMLTNIAYHVDCFNCQQCKTDLINGFHHNYGRLFCGKCLLALVPVCGNCNQVIGFSPSVKAANLEWHVNCCVCEACKKPFEGGRYFALNGRPYCLQDYWNRKVDADASAGRTFDRDSVGGGTKKKNAWKKIFDEHNVSF